MTPRTFAFVNDPDGLTNRESWNVVTEADLDRVATDVARLNRDSPISAVVPSDTSAAAYFISRSSAARMPSIVAQSLDEGAKLVLIVEVNS
jgi:hypothetical protein